MTGSAVAICATLDRKDFSESHTMRNHDSGFLFVPRAVVFAFALCSVGVFLGALSFAATPAPAGWAIVTSPNSSAAEANSLDAVACASPSDCWAIGSYDASGVQQTLIQHWNGTSWAIVPSPNTGATQDNVLKSVTCASASDCWAVGWYNNGEIGSVDRTLIQRWNGTSWSIVASPNNGTNANRLKGVTCASAAECWAVGDYVFTGNLFQTFDQTMIQRWDGTSWSIVESQNSRIPDSYMVLNHELDNYLESVTCASASDCWAVGSVNRYQTVIQRWDGLSWSLVPSANAGAEDYNLLQSVTCASSSECWAAGYWYPLGSGGEESPKTLIQRWNGSAWSLVSSPNPSASSSLSSVACASASECWAVGRYHDGISNQTLIQKWDGSSWANFPSPNVTGKQLSQLSAVTCAGDSGCWAVGSSSGPGVPQTLIARYTSAAIPAAQLQNISTRLRVQTGDKVLIGGFIITGTTPKKIILRAIGPSLSANGAPLSGRLIDPTLELLDDGGGQIDFNDNWKDSPQRAEIESSTIAPVDDREAAIVRTLAPGSYTAIVRGIGDTTGIALVEAYDGDPVANSRMANISTRGFVETGDNVMIGGLIIGPTDRGNTPILVRAIGPSLTSEGVPDALPDPILSLHDQDGTLLMENDNWKDTQRVEIEAAGIPPKLDAEAAVVRMLGPGNYTAVVRGQGESTGIALVEVYNLGRP